MGEIVDLSTVPGVEPVTSLLDWFTASFVTFLPLVLSAIIILLFGWFFAKLIERISKRSLIEIKVDEWEKQNDIKKALYGISLVDFIPSVLKWYVILLFTNEAANQVKLSFIAETINQILTLIPQWFVGGFFMGSALIIAHKIHDRFSKSKIMFGSMGARLAYFLIIYFASVLSLPKFGFSNTQILVDAFRLIVAGFSLGLAIAIGVSFGSALKKPVKNWIDDLLK